ncbi:hypothetical protein BC835DRAFT_257569 [Cytidiella melzeri]|nr:hypothetical protein BC835DRAFT_257569 [Cytidiella melzeri]
MCFSWWISTFPCLCILYYTGQVVGPPPTQAVCLASASLTMAQTILVASTGPALILHIWLVVRTAINPRLVGDTWIRRSTFFCLGMPYLLFICTVLAVASVGLWKPHIVHRVKFYCIVEDASLTKTISICGVIFVGVAIFLEVWTVILLCRNRVFIGRLSREGYELDFPLILRVCVFGLYVFLGLCLEVMSLIRWTSPILDLFFSTFSIAVFVVFGTQRDIWHVWRQTTPRVGGTISQPSASHQTQPRFIQRYLSRFSSRHPSSMNPLFATSTHSQRQPSYTQQPSRSQSWRSRSVLSRHSFTHSDVQGYEYTAPILPLAAIHRASRYEDHPAVTAYSTPELSNDAQRTPTSPATPDLVLSHLDHTQKPGEFIQRKPLASSLGFDLAQPPQLDCPTFNATIFDSQFLNSIDEIFVPSDTLMLPRQAREDHKDGERT